jgi:cysteine-rich repeat protein
MCLLVLLIVSCNGDGGLFPECGNAAVEGAEDCDDGNVISCDGCSPDCEAESGFVCGDGVVNAACGEECDDGNADPGDGCDGSCQSETCGNGVVDTGEDCDDGNDVSCDGCSASCEAEPGFVCGDGVINAACGEECDDGNTDPADGCDALCMLEVCGDGDVDAGEDCDDGNTIPCDGCSADCENESGLVCGDGILNATCGEECDDGGTVSCDGCSATCETELGFMCGDGVVNADCGEECDDGNTMPGDGCDENCVLETPPLSITGEYSVDIDGQDSCGFGTGPASSPMEAIELGATRVNIDIPVGGAGGECNPQEVGRQGNTLTLIQSSMQQIGSCIMQVDVTTVLTFFDDDTVTGFEDSTLTEAGGDCSSQTLPCQIQLDLVGARCQGCFSCVIPAVTSVRRGMGPLGAAAGATFEAPGRR